MLENKQKTKRVWQALCIIAALMLGAFLGSPASKTLTGQISEAISEITIQAVKMQYIHTEERTADKPFNADKQGDRDGKVHTASFQSTTMQTLRDLTAETEKNADQIPEDQQPAAEAFQDDGDAAAAFTAQSSAIDMPAGQTAEYLVTNANRGGAATRKEIDVLVHLINAEAYGLSYKAKVAVGQVVMNRWTGPFYGDDLLAIMTAPHQFTPIYNGSAYKKKIEPDSIQAAYAVLAGTGVDELTDDTYYFVNPDFTQDKTIETKMQFVCEIEGMHFFKPPAK